MNAFILFAALAGIIALGLHVRGALRSVPSAWWRRDPPLWWYLVVFVGVLILAQSVEYWLAVCPELGSRC